MIILIILGLEVPCIPTRLCSQSQASFLLLSVYTQQVQDVPVIKSHCGFVVATLILELLFSAESVTCYYYYYKKLHGEVEHMHAVGLDTCVSCAHLEIVLARQLTSREGLRPGLLEKNFFYLLTVHNNIHT